MNDARSPEEADFVRRLKQAVEGAGRVTDLAKQAGLPEKTVYNWLSGQNASKAIAFAKIAAAAGASVQSLLGMREHAETGENKSASMPEVADFAFIPILEAEASAGIGTENHNPEIIGHFPFPRDLLKRLGIKPDRVKGIRSRGVSMEPTIADGSLLLVNTAKESIVEGSVYALLSVDGLRIKRIQRQMDGGLLLISDNRDLFPPEKLSRYESEGIKILGRVFWTERLL